ncbi:methyl-accepting chemotaxis protein [Clostridium cellulovorans]|uniref:Methyl-accepting chemotaxis sensory transducer with Cache sensor n=1 Tax=Clostridium cellulovorans (strain ATCC 35296 / DSM 3052 / OCM 3 / 743B) TaxID=573061 RepID=D9SR85_CLOC7|nr:methyl-accepting chemotaxis protein [Clostridium cellulovorans]ADL50373.1 methyl-accepting chemotaxis sensory transducer with Cache sensor [Clostridium cellulovorans 743B]
MKNTKRKFKSIRTKLIFSIFLVSFIPIILLGISSYEITRSKLTETFKSSTIETMSEINREITTYLDGLDNVINMLTTNKSLKSITKDPSNKDNIEYLFKNLKDNNNNISSIFMATEEKKLLSYPASNASTNSEVTKNDWYTAAMSNRGNIVYSNPYISASTGKTVVSMSKTIDYEGLVIGVVGMEIDFDRLSGNISLIELGKEGFIYITNVDGIMLAHPDTTQLGNTDITNSPIWEDIQSEESNFKQYDSNGVEKFAFFTTNQKTKWRIIGTMDASELLDNIKKLRYILIFSIFALTILSSSVALVISNKMSRNINKLKTAFSSASEGDLTVSTSISSKDEFEELSNDFNTMISKIAKLMDRIHLSSNTVLETSATLVNISENTAYALDEVSRSVEDISQGAVEQANNSLNSAAEMTTLAKGIDEISDLTSDMNDISLNTQTLSKKGVLMLETLVNKTNETLKVSKEVNTLVLSMDNSTKEINEISNTISEITERTNLLSLNASIEAARAGEAGKGFAVVANEIRNLAEQSEEAAAKIRKIIDSIQKKSTVAVSAMETSNVTISEQKLAVDRTESIFHEIIASIDSLINSVTKTKLSIDEINSKKNLVLENIEQTSAISEEAAAATEEANAATVGISETMKDLTTFSDKLQKISIELQQYISVFKYIK